MAKAYFYLAGNNLGYRELDDNDSVAYDDDFAEASISLSGQRITVRECGEQVRAFTWAEGSVFVDDVETTSVDDAAEKIRALGFNGGGSAPTSEKAWHDEYVTYSGEAIPVPSGFEGSVTNMDVPQSEFTFNVVGTNLTITSGATNGERLHITGIYPQP